MPFRYHICLVTVDERAVGRAASAAAHSQIDGCFPRKKRLHIMSVRRFTINLQWRHRSDIDLKLWVRRERTHTHTYTKFTIIFMLHLQRASYVREHHRQFGGPSMRGMRSKWTFARLYSTFWFIRQCDVLQFRNFDVFTRLIVCTWFSIKI